MKAIIEGKRYDTDADGVECLAGTGYGNAGDFEHWSEALYQTPSGAYFIAGGGGAKSQYAQSVGGGTISGGEGIRVLTPDEAYEWLERHRLVEAIESHFPDRVQDA